MTRHIFIACPSNGGAPDYSTALSVSSAQLQAHERGWRCDVVYRVKDSDIVRARDALFTLFYNSQATDLLFIDDDIGCAPGSVMRLMDHPVDLVGGAYRSRRGDKEEYVLKSLDHGMLEFDQSQKTGLMQVEAVPTGFMRVSRNAAEKLVERFADDWYYDSTVRDAKGELVKTWHLFDFVFVREKRHRLSEDYEFCRKWREDCGGKVYVDPFLELTHTGKEAFSGQLLDFLKRSNPQTPAPTEAKPATILELAKAAAA